MLPTKLKLSLQTWMTFPVALCWFPLCWCIMKESLMKNSRYFGHGVSVPAVEEKKQLLWLFVSYTGHMITFILNLQARHIPVNKYKLEMVIRRK